MPHENQWNHDPDSVNRGPQPRTSPSGRVPQWVLDEDVRRAEALVFGSRPGPPPKPSGLRKSRRVRGARRAWKPWLVIALLAGLYYSPVVLEKHIMPAISPLVPGSNVPPRGIEAAADPLGRPPAGTGSGSFRLLPSPNPDQDFVAYDPCRPIHYVIRPENSPAGGEALIHQAVAEIASASGLRFIYDGPTAEGPSKERETYQPERYGKRWAPVLLTWSDPEETPDLEGDVGGLGGSDYAHVPGHPFVYVAGQVVLDAPGLAPILGYPGGPELIRAVVIHELGHVLGLDHVDDPGQLMYGGSNDRAKLADGDRAGLALLGTGACVPQL